MSPRRKKAIVICAAVAGVICLAALWRTPEPVHLGKPVSGWFDLVLAGPTNLTAIDALQGMGTNAVPFLITRLDRRDTAVRRFYARRWTNAPASLQAALPKPPDILAEQITALLFLKRLGPGAARAMPSLVGLAHDTAAAMEPKATLVPDTPLVAGYQMVWSQPFVPAQTASSRPENVLFLNLCALAVLGTDDKQAALAMLDASRLTHRSGRLRWTIRFDEWLQLAPAAANALPELTRALDNPETRLGAVELLRLAAYVDERAVVPLLPVVAADEGEASITATEPLGRVEKRVDDVLPVLIQALGNSRVDRNQLRSAHNAALWQKDYSYPATLALQSLAEHAEKTVPALIEALGRDNPRIRAGAAATLGNIHDPRRARAIPGLKQMAAADVPEVQLAAARALTRIDPGDESEVRLHLVELKHGKEHVRADAIHMMTPHAANRPEAITGMLAAFRTDASPAVRGQAARALGILGVREVIPELKSHTQDGTPFLLRREAIRALEKLEAP